MPRAHPNERSRLVTNVYADACGFFFSIILFFRFIIFFNVCLSQNEGHIGAASYDSKNSLFVPYSLSLWKSENICIVTYNTLKRWIAGLMRELIPLY